MAPFQLCVGVKRWAKQYPLPLGIFSLVFQPPNDLKVNVNAPEVIFISIKNDQKKFLTWQVSSNSFLIHSLLLQQVADLSTIHLDNFSICQHFILSTFQFVSNPLLGHLDRGSRKPGKVSLDQDWEGQASLKDEKLKS